MPTKKKLNISLCFRNTIKSLLYICVTIILNHNKMKLSEKIKKALASVQVVPGVSSVNLTLKHDDVAEMKEYAKDNKLHLHTPIDGVPYFWFACSDAHNENIRVTVDSPNYDINITYKLKDDHDSL